MKYLDDFRDAGRVRALAKAVDKRATRPWTLMEVCGGQTHTIMHYGLSQLLPEGLRLVHGPGCPVCVTPQDTIDLVIAMAEQEPVTLCVYGDMMRVPGSNADLNAAKARGGDVRVVSAPLSAVELARDHPDREVVFFAVGFETTAPASALAVLQAQALGLRNFSLLVSHVRVPPAIEALAGSPHNEVQAFLAAGHVCSVTGAAEYHPLARRHRVPIVITGFEPVDIMMGVLSAVAQLETGRAEVGNAYSRVVREQGNPAAQAAVDKVFEVVDQEWRGLGVIPESGLGLRSAYAGFDARRRFAPARENRRLQVVESPCIAGQILSGRRRPDQCPAFGTECTPTMPLGAPMVSNEGACSAYFRYRDVAVA